MKINVVKKLFHLGIYRTIDNPYNIIVLDVIAEILHCLFGGVNHLPILLYELFARLGGIFLKLLDFGSAVVQPGEQFLLVALHNIRNKAFCLFSDDDITYNDDVEKKVLAEFDTHPDADIIIFHLNSDDPTRTPKKYSKTKKHSRLKGLRWGATRVAFRLSAAKKANLWFTTLFGGGCVFAAGEDSLWLNEARKKGLKFYVSKETIGNVSFESSTWFTGYDEKLFYGKGAFCAQKSPRFANIWPIYYVWRFRNKKELSSKEKYVWMKHGIKGYREMLSFNAYKEKYKL